MRKGDVVDGAADRNDGYAATTPPTEGDCEGAVDGDCVKTPPTEGNCDGVVDAAKG